jgi:hypothetical protein
VGKPEVCRKLGKEDVEEEIILKWTLKK